MTYLETFGRELWAGVARMGAFFVLAVLVAGAIKTFKLDKKIRHSLAGAGAWSIPLATVTGLVSPLCSCGILPVVASLMAAGVPTAPVMALLISSPVMSPDAFVLTWGVLGPWFAWAKLLGAAALGLGLGYLVEHMERRGWIPAEPLRGPGPKAAHHCVDSGDPTDPRRGLTVTINRWRYFGLMVRDMSWFIGRFLIAAYVLEALMRTFVRPNAVKVLLGRDSLGSVLLAAAVGVPLPLHQVAVVPILRGLLDLGASAAAAATLMMAGPVASIPAVVFLSGMVDRRLLWAYLAVGCGGAVLLGLLFAA